MDSIWNGLQRKRIDRNKIEWIATKCNGLQCNAMQCNLINCNAID